MNNWYNNLGINLGLVFFFVNKNKLLNEFGISFYFSSNFCFFILEIFSLVNSMGWKNGMFIDYCILSLNCFINLIYIIYIFKYLYV